MFKYLKKNFTKNISIKIFCLFSATILWIYIAAGQNTIAKYPGSIAIKAINIPSGLVAIYDTKTVDIKIMAQPSVWNKLSPDSFSAYIDLSGQKEGTYELPVNVVSSTAGVDIVEKNPNKIIVSLEPIVSKEVSINSKIEGSAAEGLVAGNIILDPSRTIIRGPKSVINDISEATAVINLNGESEKFSKKIALVALDGQGEFIDNIGFDPAEVSATVAVVKASNNKTVGVRVKTTGSLKTGYFISNITVSPSTVDITGVSSLLKDVAYLETMPLDLSNQSSDFEKDVALNMQSGIALQVGSPAKVRVKISLSKNIVTKELSSTINYLNLGSRQVNTVTPGDIRVICSGPSDLINNLKSSDIILNLDFSDKNLSDSVINFELSSANFKTPENVDVVSVVPSSINVTITKR